MTEIKPEARDIKSTIEAVICVYKGEELVAIVKKNGENIFYNVDKMAFDDIAQLLNAEPNHGK